jgi:hypothetical protein
MLDPYVWQTVTWPGAGSHFDLHHTVFLANVIGTNKTIALPPQGISVPDLMGELSYFLTLPSYQHL